MLHLILHTLFFGAFPVMFFGIGQGPSKQEKDIFGLLSGMATFESGTGMKDISSSSSYWQDILSGDPAKMAAAIAPETKVIQGQAQQQKNRNAEFGTRSGGTAASNAAIDTNVLSSTQDLVNRLRPQAANALNNQGTNLLGIGGSTATSAFGAASTMQAQTAAMWNDIFQSIGKVLEMASGFAAPGGSLQKGLSGAGGVIGG